MVPYKDNLLFFGGVLDRMVRVPACHVAILDSHCVLQGKQKGQILSTLYNDLFAFSLREMKWYRMELMDAAEVVCLFVDILSILNA